MTASRFSNSARYWRSPLVPGAEMLTAEYYDHSFTPHWHDAYTVPVIEAGAEQYDYRGSNFVARMPAMGIMNASAIPPGESAMPACCAV